MAFFPDSVLKWSCLCNILYEIQIFEVFLGVNKQDVIAPFQNLSSLNSCLLFNVFLEDVILLLYLQSKQAINMVNTLYNSL